MQRVRLWAVLTVLGLLAMPVARASVTITIGIGTSPAPLIGQIAQPCPQLPLWRSAAHFLFVYR
jgi:hypothetical protein